MASNQVGPQLQELAYEVIERDERQGNSRVTLQSHCTTGRGWLLPRLQVQYTIEENRVYSDCDVKPNMLFSVWIYFLCISGVILGIVAPLFTMNESGYPWFFPVSAGFGAFIMFMWCRYLSKRELNKLITKKYIEQVYIRFAITETATKG